MSERKYQKHDVRLSAEEREELVQIIRKGAAPARTIQHANVLLASDKNGNPEKLTDAKIGEMYHLHWQTVAEIRMLYCREGLERAIARKRRETPPPPKITGDIEAKIVALACSQPPAGSRRWTLRLLADKTVELGYLDSISPESVRQTLKKQI